MTPSSNRAAVTERPAIAVDVVLFMLGDENEATLLPDRPQASTHTAERPERRRQLQVLLTRRHDQPFAGRWCLPGDWVGPNERLEQVALRELAAAGVENMYLEQLFSFD